MLRPLLRKYSKNIGVALKCDVVPMCCVYVHLEKKISNWELGPTKYWSLRWETTKPNFPGNYTGRYCTFTLVDLVRALNHFRLTNVRDVRERLTSNNGTMCILGRLFLVRWPWWDAVSVHLLLHIVYCCHLVLLPHTELTLYLCQTNDRDTVLVFYHVSPEVSS